MNWKTTWILLAVAGCLFAFIFLVERHSVPTSESVHAPARLLDFQIEEVKSLQFRHGTDLFLRVDRTNGQWQLTFPLNYPAQPVAIEGLLEELSQLDKGTFLTPEELEASQQTVAQFGLDVPAMAVTLQHRQKRLELLFGAKTSVGDRVYLQTRDSPNIYVVPASVFDRMPRDPNEWRDPALVDLTKVVWDRLEVRMPTGGYAIQTDVTNRSFMLSKPSPARANLPKILELLRAIHGSRVQSFVEDNPLADLESFGLDNPVASLIFGRGTNDLLTIQFGQNPSNDLSLVYALCSAHTNVVLVNQSLLEALQVSHADLREKRLLTARPESIDLLAVGGKTNWVLRRKSDGQWTIPGLPPVQADNELVQFLLARLGQLEGEVEREVVTDFSEYGLVEPALTYRFHAAVTNASGAATNRLLGGLDFGEHQEEKVFVRRIDEQSVYSMPHAEFALLPQEAWQMRHRQIWTFTTNEIARVTLQRAGKEVALLRTGPARWELAPGSQGIINDLAVEETMYRLGNLRADFWLARGEQYRSQFGLNETNFLVSIQMKTPQTLPRVYTVVFGQAAPGQFPYAMAEVDGQRAIFEFPKKLYFEIVRDLMKPFWGISAMPP